MRILIIFKLVHIPSLGVVFHFKTFCHAVTQLLHKLSYDIARCQLSGDNFKTKVIFSAFQIPDIVIPSGYLHSIIISQRIR